MIHDLWAWIGCVTGFPSWTRLGRVEVCAWCAHARSYHRSVPALLYLFAGRWLALLGAILTLVIVGSVALMGGSTPSTGAAFLGRVNDQSFATASLNLHDHQADVWDAVEHASLVGWQEAGVDSRRAIEAIPDSVTYGLATQDPITWRTARWTLRSSGTVLLHEGRDGAGPDRVATWVRVRLAGTDTVVARVNTHLVAHAWCEHRVPFKDWRRHVWLASVDKIKALVRYLARISDAVIVGGDFNREGRVLGDLVAYDLPLGVGTFGAAHYDYLMHAPRDALRVTGAFTVPMRSDHDEAVVRYAPSH